MMMKKTFNVLPGDIIAAVGPSISKDFYEVDDYIINQFRLSYHELDDFVAAKGKGRYLLDLKLANIIGIQQMGVPADHILISDYCTFRDSKYFYSYRREQGETGRMASIIFL